jgi:hypothetical protein
VVHGDIQELVGDARLSTAELVNEGLAGGPREEHADNVCIDDVGERVALPGELADVVLQGLTGLLLVALEVPGVSGAHICPVEVPEEDLLELRPTTDAVGRQEFEPCSNMLPNIDGEVLDDEVVIIHPSSSAGESEVFQP